MRKLLTLAVIIILATLTTSRAQQVFEIPACKPTLKSVIETLADWSLEHQRVVSAGEHWGLTQARNRSMFVSDEPALAIRKMAVLHELMHACYRNFDPLGTRLPREIEEQLVLTQTDQMYQELFANDTK